LKGKLADEPKGEGVKCKSTWEVHCLIKNLMTA